MSERRPVRRVLVGVVVSAATLSCPLVAQQQRPSFRARTDLVQLDVVVLDKDRQPVTGLTARDFAITENGRARAIQAFASVTLPEAESLPPGRAAWTRDVVPDVVSNAHADEGRLVVILMDRTIPMEAGTVVARTIAKAAIDALGPNDLAAVVRDTGFANDAPQQDFTADKTRLKALIDQPFVGLVNPPDMEPLGLTRGSPELLKTGDCYCGLCVLESIARVANALFEGPGRQKTILFVGSDIVVQLSGERVSQASADYCTLPLKMARERAFRALDRSNVVVHSIDPSGLQTLAKGADAFPHDAATSTLGELGRQGDLAVFPDYTGGRTVVNTNDPQLVVPRIFRESQSYYEIGFTRGDSRAATELHRIRVVVKGRPELTVLARTGYYSSTSDAAPAPPSADASVGGLLPNPDVPLHLGLAPHFGDDNHADVHPLLGLDEAILPRGTAQAATFDIVTAVLDEKAKSVASARQTIELTPAKTMPARLDVALEPLTLPPGRYEVRIGVSRRGSSDAGSVYGYVDVPNLGDAPLALSGVTLQALARPAGNLPLPIAPILTAPTVRRTFTASELVTAFVQVHAAPKIAAAVALRARIRDEADRVVSDAAVPLDAAALHDAGLADAAVDVPVTTLAPGRYLLTIEATSSDHLDQRDVPFQVGRKP